MPPQPLSRVNSTATYMMCGNALTRRPVIAAEVAQCIASWSLVEMVKSELFLRLLSTNHQDGIALFHSLESVHAKNNAIRTLALSSLDKEDYKLVDGLLKLIKSRQSIRDRLSHWLWGISEDLPDVLILADPNTVVKTNASIYEKYLKGAGISPTTVPRDEIFVYRADDLRADDFEFHTLVQIILAVTNYVWRRRTIPGFVGQRDELAKDARLAPFLSPRLTED
jgi:hypothetical protein